MRFAHRLFGTGRIGHALYVLVARVVPSAVPAWYPGMRGYVAHCSKQEVGSSESYMYAGLPWPLLHICKGKATTARQRSRPLPTKKASRFLRASCLKQTYRPLPTLTTAPPAPLALSPN